MAKKQKEAVARGDKSRLQWTWHLMKQYKIGYVMIAPYMILFILMTVIPVLGSIFVSFTDYNLLQMPNWVGLDNYINLFLNDELFTTALKYTLIFAISVGLGSYILSFIVAWFVNELSPKVRAFVTLIFYAPSLVAGSIYVVFNYVFSGDSYGLINGWLMNWGVISDPILFFADVRYILPTIIVIQLWMSLGTAFLSFIAGFQGLDRSQMEAGAVDGITNRWQELWYITLPNLKPQLMFGAIMSITSSFGVGGYVTQFCQGLPTDYVGYTLGLHLGEYGGTRWEFGYGCAISMVLFFLMVGTNMIVQKMLSKVGNS
ncbi:MAG: sugar ABC transporter permease [Clostridiales bacterium]|nr:sugar ABC transporter permease [Clostridiales bacterium]